MGTAASNQDEVQEYSVKVTPELEAPPDPPVVAELVSPEATDLSGESDSEELALEGAWCQTPMPPRQQFSKESSALRSLGPAKPQSEASWLPSQSQTLGPVKGASEASWLQSETQNQSLGPKRPPSEAPSLQSLGPPTPTKPHPLMFNYSLSTTSGSGTTLRDLVVGGSAHSSERSLTKSERHNSRRYSDVDKSMVRGISLRRSLGGLGRLWRFDPSTWQPQQRGELYAMSSPAMFFNIFISHTWLTPGRWKILSLWLQCGWPFALAFWCMGVFTSFVLCAWDILPMPLSYHSTLSSETYPMGFWIVSCSTLSTFFGLMSAPYWPDRCCNDTCFIDVASIHQVDQKLMERGVYGIAGFLRISQELRILFSGPYFSRLWCIFEIAAYKKVNPSGKITFRPLLFEAVVVGLLLSAYCFCYIYLAWTAIDAFEPETTAWAYTAFASWFVPLTIASYGLRMLFRSKYNLLQELEEFDLDSVQCSKQFDRDFIHSAIVKWYGSKQAFTSYVRYGLKEELASTLFAAKLPYEYLLLIATPTISLCLEFLLASWKGGVPLEHLVSYSVVVILALGVFWIAAAVMLMIYLCDYFAPCQWGLCDHILTVIIICLVTGFVSAGTQLAAYAFDFGVEGAVLYLCASVVMAGSVKWLEGKTGRPSTPARKPGEMAG